MSNVIAQLAQIFTKNDWDFDVHEDKALFSGWNHQGINYRFYFAEEGHSLRFKLALGIAAVHEFRSMMVELLMRINETVVFGAFKMDFENGNIYFEFNQFASSEPDADKVELTIAAAVRTSSDFYAAMVCVNSGMVDAESSFNTAIERIEAWMSENTDAKVDVDNKGGDSGSCHEQSSATVH